jgi:hypothetical protein
VSYIDEATALDEDEPGGPPPDSEALSGEPKAWAAGFLTVSGFLASVVSFTGELGATDLVADVAGGLATAGLVSTAIAAVTVLWRRRQLAGQVKARVEVRQDINDRVKTAESRADLGAVVKAAVRTELLMLKEDNDARLKDAEQRMARTGWLQGAVFAAFGAAVAVLIVVLGHWLPIVK